MKKDFFIKKFSEEIREGNAAIFAGAGISVGAGYVDWKQLLKPFAKELDLDIDKETDLVRVAQYYITKKGGNRGEINRKILNKFSEDVESTKTIDLLTRLPIGTYWTTNYDQILENQLIKNKKKVDVKKDQTSLASNKNGRDAVIYKMHGDVEFPHDAVISTDDYETYNETHALFTTALKGDLISKTFLFIGFSFEDPNLNDILGKIKILVENNTRTHYCIMKKVDQKDFDDETNFELAKVRQNLREEDLKRYGIDTVFVNSYDEIPKMLEDIEKIYLNNTIFISGSISSYNGDWKEKEVEEFCYELSKNIVKDNYKIISGFGLGVGSSIINGALDEIYLNKNKHVKEHLSLYPFPQNEVGEKTLKERWTENRETMISDAGICIFIFGNKKDGLKTVKANGMIEEFQIAEKLGKYIIPIGNTGEAANDIFNTMEDDKQKYPYLDTYWDKLKNGKDESIISTIVEIIKNQQE